MPYIPADYTNIFSEFDIMQPIGSLILIDYRCIYKSHCYYLSPCQ